MKISPLLVILVFLLKAGLESAPLNVSVSAEAAILMNADSGALLYEKKPRAKLFPASITKIATAAYALKLKKDDLSDMITAEQDCIGSVTEEAKVRSGYTLPSHWLVTDCSHMGIKRGETLSLNDLLYGMMVASADDASNIIAHFLGNGSIAAFMEGVNIYLKQLGCQDTYFNNPHGLHHPKHVTTAYDVAIMTQDALKNPRFREIVATTRFTRPKTNKQESTILVQTNRLLRAGEFYYPRAIGVKTGKHSKAGNTLVAAAEDQGRTLIAVLLNVKDRKEIFKDAIRLFDAAFQEVPIEKVVVKAGPQRYSLALEGAKEQVQTKTLEDARIAYFPAEEPKVKAFLQWEKLELPVKKGQKVGEIQLKGSDERLLKSVSLYAENDVNGHFSYRLKNWMQGKSLKIGVFAAVAALVLFGLFLLYRK